MSKRIATSNKVCTRDSSDNFMAFCKCDDNFLNNHYNVLAHSAADNYDIQSC